MEKFEVGPTPRWGTRFGNPKITPETLLAALEREVCINSPNTIIEILAELAHAGFAWAAVSHLATFIAPLYIGIAEPMWPKWVCDTLDEIDVALRTSDSSYATILADMDSARAYFSLGIQLAAARKNPLVGTSMQYWLVRFATYSKIVDQRFRKPPERDIFNPSDMSEQTALRSATFHHILYSEPLKNRWKMLAMNAPDANTAAVIANLRHIALRMRLAEPSKNMFALFFNAIFLRFRGISAMDASYQRIALDSNMLPDAEVIELASDKHVPFRGADAPEYWFEPISPDLITNERYDEYTFDPYSKRVLEAYSVHPRSSHSIFIGHSPSFDALLIQARRNLGHRISGPKKLRKLLRTEFIDTAAARSVPLKV